MRVKADLSIIYTEERKKIDEIITLTKSNFFNGKIEVGNITESNLKNFGISLCYFENYYNSVYPAIDFFESKYIDSKAKKLSNKAEKLGYILNVCLEMKDNFNYKFALYFIYSLCYFSKGVISVGTYHPNSLNLNDIYTLDEWMDFIKEQEKTILYLI